MDKKTYSRLLEKPLNKNRSFFLFGPRGTGKTFWLKSKIKNGFFIDLLNEEIFFTLLKNPHQIEHMVPKNFKNWIVIDEIQKIPALLNEVHRMIESYGYKFVLTGSSARKLRKKGVNLLAGRAIFYNMFPLTALELKIDFNIKKSLQFGQLPIAYCQADPKDYLSSYVYTYLKEEVMQEGLVRNAGSFARFLQTASFSQGSILNVTEIAREAGVERKTVEDYFQITQDLLLADRISVFTKKAKRKTISRQKFYYFDVGVYRTLRPMGPFDMPEDIGDIALESLVFQELKAINSYFQFEYEIYFWQTIDKMEIDFILYGVKGLIGIEVKSSKKIYPKDLKALKVFQSDYPSAKLYIFYAGERHLYFDKIIAVPVIEAIKNLDKILNN